MANQLPLLENLTKQDIQELINACIRFDGKAILGPDYIEVSEHKISSLGLYWSSKREFERDIEFITGGKNIPEANKLLEKKYLTAPDVKNDEINSNLPDKDIRAQQQAELEKNKEVLEKTKAEAEKSVQESIDKKRQVFERQQKINEIRNKYQEEISKQRNIAQELKDQKIYAKVEKIKSINPEDSTKQFINEAKEHPQSFRTELSNTIKAKLLSSNLPEGITSGEIDIIADKVANDTLFAITNPEQQIESVYKSAILQALSKQDSSISNSLKTETQSQIRNSAYEMYFYQNSSQFSKEFISSINKNLAESVFGPDPANINVQLSPTPGDDYTHEINLGQLSSGYSDLLASQSDNLTGLRSYTEGTGKSLLLGQARRFLDSQISKLPTDSLVRGIYNSSFGQKILSSVGLVKEIPFANGFWGSVLSKIPGAPTFLQGIAGKFGIDLGFKLLPPPLILADGTIIKAGISALPAVTEGAATGIKGLIGNAIAKVAPGLAAKLGITVAASASAGASSGFLAGIAGGPLAIVTTIVGFLAGVIKAYWPKIKQFFETYGPGIGAAMLGGGILFSSPALAIMSAPVLLASIPRIGGIKATGKNFTNLLKMVAAYLALKISTPIIIIALLIPVLITITLFIINTGAYITPQGSGISDSSNPYIQVDKVAEPTGPFKNEQLPIKIKYTVTIKAKKSELTNIVFKNECQIFTKNPAKDCPAPLPDEIPGKIEPSSPYIYTYESNYSGPNYIDSVVLDTFTVIADTTDAKNQEVSGAASISIGNPPAACIIIDSKGWPPEYYSNIIYARSILGSEFGSYISKVCLSYPSLPIKYNPVSYGTYWGWNHGTYIDMFQLGVKSKDDALYTLAHELGHSFAWGSKTAKFYQTYLETPGINKESPYCFYSATLNWNSDESMPESIAIRILNLVENRCGSVQSKWPIHYNFLMKYVFN